MQDPGAPDEQAGKGQILISFGKLFEKGLSLGTGQCNVKAYNRYLRDLIVAGRAKPSFVVSHEVPIDEAVEAAKDLCSAEAPKFVNGILGAVQRTKAATT